MNAECVAVIPARISSTRIKEKPIADLGGKPLIQWVYENALKIRGLDNVVIATDSEKIADRIREFNGEFRITPEELNSGSDRVYYTVEKYLPSASIIVNIQGDEPFLDTELVGKLIDAAKNSDISLISAYYNVPRNTAQDKSVVKVVTDRNDMALYFSRSMIPESAEIYKKHLGVYVWKKGFLKEFYNTRPTPLEQSERLEQLRVLEMGGSIKMMKSDSDSIGIDTYEDLENARGRISAD